jgi:hypothetical protein
MNRKIRDSFNVDGLAVALEMGMGLALTARGHASERVVAPPASKISFRKFLLLDELSDAPRLGLTAPLVPE